MNKIIIPCILTCALTINNSIFGMLLKFCNPPRPYTKQILTQQRKCHGFSDTQFKQIMAQLRKQEQNTRVLFEGQEAIAKLQFSFMTNDPDIRARMFHEFLKKYSMPSDQSPTDHNDLLTHEFGDECPVLGHYRLQNE